MKFEPIKIIFFISWCLSFWVSTTRSRYIGFYIISLIAAGSSLFIASPQIKVMSWFSTIWIAYLIATTEGRKSLSGLAQKHFMIQIFGALVAILGVALVGFDSSFILVLLGVLVVTPTFLHSVFFARFYESLSRRAYFFAVVVPALVGIDLLFSMRAEIKQSYPLFWQISLLTVGTLGLLVNAYLSLIKNRTRAFLVFVSQAWLGMMLVLLTSDSPDVPLALGSISVFLVNGLMSYVEAKAHQKRISALVISVLVGMPFFVGFNSLFYSMRALELYSVVGLLIFLLMILFQAGAVVLNLSRNGHEGEGRDKLKLILFCGISFLSSVAIHLVGIKYAVD